jgi:hypothetical protein
VRGGGASDADDEPGVVLELAVPVQQRTPNALGAQRGGEPARLVRRDPPGSRQPVGAEPGQTAQPVAYPQAGLDAGGLTPAGRLVERDHEGQRADQMRSGAAHEDGPLARGFPGEPDVARLEVPQAPVDELRAPAARPVGEVAPLEQRDGEPARGGVERHPRPGDAAADHHHIDRLTGREHVEVGGAPRGVERGGARHAVGRR